MTEKLVQTDCEKKLVQTEILARRNFTQSSFYRAKFVSAQKPLRTVFFLCAAILQTDGFYTESSPHRSVTHRIFYAQHFLHTDAFIHRCFYTENELHTETCAHRALLHTTSFHTKRFCSPFLITYLSCSPSQVCRML